MINLFRGFFEDDGFVKGVLIADSDRKSFFRKRKIICSNMKKVLM